MHAAAAQIAGYLKQIKYGSICKEYEYDETVEGEKSYVRLTEL